LVQLLVKAVCRRFCLHVLLRQEQPRGVKMVNDVCKAGLDATAVAAASREAGQWAKSWGTLPTYQYAKLHYSLLACSRLHVIYMLPTERLHTCEEWARPWPVALTVCLPRLLLSRHESCTETFCISSRRHKMVVRSLRTSCPGPVKACK
jgi:hypothetical protein